MPNPGKFKPQNDRQKQIADELREEYKRRRDLKIIRTRETKEANKLSVESSLNEKLRIFEEQGVKLTLTELEKELLQKRIELLKLRKKELIKNNPLCKFTPNAKQHQVIGSVGSGNIKIFLLSAGNGFGKTAVAVNILANLIWGAQPFNPIKGTAEEYCSIDSPVNWVDAWGTPPETWYTAPLYDKWPFPKVFRIVSDQKNVDDEGAIQEEVDRWWPKDRFKSEKGKYSYRSKFKIDNGWRGDVLTYEMETKQFESKTLGVVLFDEPPPARIWGSTLSRMRRGGIIFIVMTPLFEAAYLYNQIVEKAETNSDIAYMYADVEDNCFEHSERGVLFHADVQSMIDKYPPSEREARKSGKFVVLSGKVHKEFNREIHVVKAKHNRTDIPTRDYILANKHLYQFYQVVDPHDRKYDAVGYYAMDDRRRKYVIDEFPDSTFHQAYHELGDRKIDYDGVIKLLKAKELVMGLETDDIIRLIDPRFAGSQATRGAKPTGETVKQVWQRGYGAYFNSNILDEFTACRNKLDSQLVPASDGLPMLFFFEEFCPNHIYAIQNWLYESWQGKTQDIHDIREKAQEKNSDFPRLLHYLSIYDPVYKVRPQKIAGWREELSKKSRRVKVIGKAGISWMGR